MEVRLERAGQADGRLQWSTLPVVALPHQLGKGRAMPAAPYLEASQHQHGRTAHEHVLRLTPRRRV
jgi:hypothetical protein